MTRILSKLETEAIDDVRFVRLINPFIFESDVLREAGLQSWVEAPAGFFCDFESVPLFRGTSKRGGTAHDYLSRFDSVPVVTKEIAAKVYLEIMAYRDGIIEDQRLPVKSWRFIRRWGKYGVVRVWPRYFHRLSVKATYEEVARTI